MSQKSAPAPATTTEQSFPRSFWTANVTELFERAAFYSTASFVVLYLGQLGMGEYWPSTFNSWLWGLVYFLPILSGTIADQVGFKRALLAAFILLAIGYFSMGYPVWLGGVALADQIGDEFTAGPHVVVPAILAIILIGLGGSVIKPCISGTVQKTAGAVGKATLGFGIFYMVINIGSIIGRFISYYTRKQLDLSFIWAVAVGCSIVAFFVVLFVYRDPETEVGATFEPKKRKSIGKILVDMVLVLKNVRFALFLLVSAGFFFIYAQVYNVLPLYLKKVVETDPAVDLVTAFNPVTIVLFQLLITKTFGKLRPIHSIVIGTVIIGLSMLLNLVPVFLAGGIRQMPIEAWWPLGTIFIGLTVAMVAFGELFTSARTYEYIGALAPKGQEGLFLGYANLPMALGAIVGGPAGAAIFNEIMLKNAVQRPDGLYDLDPTWNTIGWCTLTGIGLLSALCMWIYNKWIQKHPA